MQKNATQSKSLLVIRSPLFTVAAFLIAVAYGITFPLIAVRLEGTGVGGTLVGLNAAMPPLGWIIGSALIPYLQITLGVPLRRLLQMFLLLGTVALFGLQYAESYEAMTMLRLVFGGSVGVVLRCIEYWINVASDNHQRGRNLSVYSVLFMIALIMGSSAQPEFGSSGWSAFGPPLGLLTVALVLLALWSGEPAPKMDFSISLSQIGLAFTLPIALIAVLAYGLFESVPTTFIEVYVLRNGLEPATAAYSLAAAALGNVLFQYPIAAISDRIGRVLPILFCSLAVVAASLVLPSTLYDPNLFLIVVMVWGGAAATTYSMALAMIGDRFRGSQLVLANAAFGIVYSIGSVAGPLLNGYAITQAGTHGLMFWLAAIFACSAIYVFVNQVAERKRASQ